jgi:hypothetical protein
LDGLADIAQQFYSQFLLSLLHEIFSVLTDKEHEPGFKLQCEILQHMVSRVEGGLPAAPLFNAAEHPGVTDNRQFIRAHLLKMLTDGFSERMTASQLQEFVASLFDPAKGFFFVNMDRINRWIGMKIDEEKLLLWGCLCCLWVLALCFVCQTIRFFTWSNPCLYLWCADTVAF